jgi:hypothetical protein
MSQLVALVLASLLVPSREDTASKAPPTVESILADAIAAQRAEPYASELKDVAVRLLVTTRDSQGTAVAAVERLWKAPDRTLTQIEEKATGSKVVEGYDGETFWLTKAGKTTILSGVDFRDDRARIRKDVDLMLVMMRSFFLKTALPTLEGLTLAEDAIIDQPDPADADSVVPTKCHVLKGRMTDLPEDLGLVADVTLWIAQDTHYLERVRLDPLPREDDLSGGEQEQKPLPIATELRFSGHLANEQGVIVPSGVDIYRGSRREPWQQIQLLGVESGDGGGLNNIRFNTGIDAARFAPPKK